MGTYRQDPPVSEQRSLDDNPRQSSDAAPPESFLLRRIRELEHELEAAHAHARRQAHERELLDTSLAQLREANEHLVMATVNAQHLQEDAEAANRRQNEFLAMLAHELRNPLSPISMAASMLKAMPDASPQLARLSHVIGRQVEHMARLLDDLLDAARISSGKITLSTQPLLLSRVLQHAVEIVQPGIQARRQQLHVEVPDESVVVEGDQVRLTQVFTNLLGNASKYTGDAGKLSLSTRADADGVTVCIEDNGSGIEPDIIPYIFDLFTQGPRSLARSEGGLGVGLNVVRNLVAMHAGAVEAHSEGAGRGSRFTVRLPRTGRPPASLEPTEAATVGGKRRVLVVEDNPDTCATLTSCLQDQGHEVASALDGRSGLAAALERPYDVIVCDIGLPGLDGMGLIRALRAASGGMRPLAIALSGYGQPGDMARGMDAGFDHYLVKPTDLSELLRLIAACPAQAQAQSQA
jgi:signal transduction histidine kinase/ActR/RegA family two-component response regulator